jgi:hypothetical protein
MAVEGLSQYHPGDDLEGGGQVGSPLCSNCRERPSFDEPLILRCTLGWRSGARQCGSLSTPNTLARVRGGLRLRPTISPNFSSDLWPVLGSEDST